jgi:glycosyltransferase involved in cell wall biosynthesis
MNVLFVGIGTSAPCWYRCALPARALGADWIGVGGGGDAGALTIRTGEWSRDIGGVEDLASYDVVVLQQPRGSAWLSAIADLQRRGTRVLFEIDDDVHGAATAAHHATAAKFTKPILRALEAAMRACDGLICSTEHLAARYSTFNPEVWVCQNGLDLGRYALTRSPRESVTIGFAGGTGHRPAMVPWLRELLHVLAVRHETRFMSVGAEDYASALAERFGPQRCIGLPWGPIETYPAAMSSFDIALAPAARTPFFRGKSDLRWLEASALGLPTVADPVAYPAIEDGVTGLHAATPAQAREAILTLVEDGPLRARIGAAARAYVREHRCIDAVAPQWARALGEVRALAQAA